MDFFKVFFKDALEYDVTAQKTVLFCLRRAEGAAENNFYHRFLSSNNKTGFFY